MISGCPPRRSPTELVASSGDRFDNSFQASWIDVGPDELHVVRGAVHKHVPSSDLTEVEIAAHEDYEGYKYCLYLVTPGALILSAVPAAGRADLLESAAEPSSRPDQTDHRSGCRGAYGAVHYSEKAPGVVERFVDDVASYNAAVP